MQPHIILLRKDVSKSKVSTRDLSINEQNCKILTMILGTEVSKRKSTAVGFSLFFVKVGEAETDDKGQNIIEKPFLKSIHHSRCS